MNHPNSYQELIDTFGDPGKYMLGGILSPKWEAEHMAIAKIPFLMPLSWDKSTMVNKIWGHKLMVPIWEAVFLDIFRYNLQDCITAYGGCYNFRSKRTNTKLSTHCWGIAIDLNPEENGLGKIPVIDMRLVQVFKDNGFIWGGEFPIRDGMHFQYCDGY